MSDAAWVCIPSSEPIVRMPSRRAKLFFAPPFTQGIMRRLFGSGAKASSKKTDDASPDDPRAFAGMICAPVS